MSVKLITYVQINGCDDSTHAPIELTATEFEIVQKVFDKVNESANGQCKPEVYISVEKPDYWVPDFEEDEDEW